MYTYSGKITFFKNFLLVEKLVWNFKIGKHVFYGVYIDKLDFSTNLSTFCFRVKFWYFGKQRFQKFYSETKSGRKHTFSLEWLLRLKTVFMCIVGEWLLSRFGEVFIFLGDVPVGRIGKQYKRQDEYIMIFVPSRTLVSGQKMQSLHLLEV